MKHSTIIAGLLVSTLCFTSPSQADTLQYSLNLRDNPLSTQTSLPSPKYIGMVTMRNGVKLPAYQTYFGAGWSDKDYETRAPESLTIDAELDAKLASQFVLYYFDQRWFLIPKDWHFVNASIGANASSVINFAPTQGNKGHFSAWTNNGGCYGCGLDAASYYSKQADQMNQREFDAKAQYMDTSPKMQLVALKKDWTAWRTTLGGQNIDGIVYINTDDGVYVWTAEVSLPKSQAHLATPMLNWYLPKSNRK
ncbi:DUF4850 domain-containing protein [Acinetobacter sp. c1-l78]|uniref:DUF4850 domain-containing protein n=1 Tax=Acinetobacter sp. c1-l78 TaxID=3342803 RepID=UPI0035B8970C